MTHSEKLEYYRTHWSRLTGVEKMESLKKALDGPQGRVLRFTKPDLILLDAIEPGFESTGVFSELVSFMPTMKL